MSGFFDDVARILASPMPRRRAFRLIASALTTTTLTGLGLAGIAQAHGDPICGSVGNCDSALSCHGMAVGSVCGPGRTCKVVDDKVHGLLACCGCRP